MKKAYYQVKFAGSAELFPAIFAKNIQVGTVIICDYGVKKKVIKKEWSVSGKSVFLTTECVLGPNKGKVCRQLFHCETLLAAEGPEFVGEYYYDYWK